MRYLLLAALFLLNVHLASAQQYHFSHIPFDQPSGDLRGNTLSIGDNGLLWIGTNDGLLAFDGLQYIRQHLSSDSNAISGITAIQSDAGKLWVGTDNGGLYFGDPRYGMHHAADTGAPVRRIARSSGGIICVASYGKGLFFPRHTDDQQGVTQFPSLDLYDLIIDRNDVLWVASDAGITAIDLSGNQPAKQFGSEQGIADEIIMSLAMTSDGFIWAGSFERGICSIEHAGKTFYPFPDWDHGPVVSMVAVDADEIWIATERNGVFVYHRQAHTLDPVMLPGNAAPVITDMQCDAEGNLWLLDAYQGLYRTNRHSESYDVQLEGLQALLVDHSGQLYGGLSSGFYTLQPGEQKASECILPDVNVLSLYEDNYGNLWVGTFGQGLYCKPHRQPNWYHYTKDNGLTDESILSITGLQDTLWLATLGGVTRLRVEDPLHMYRLQTTNYNLADGLGTNFIYTAFADHMGRVWFGTDGKGLSVLEHGVITNYQKADTTELHSVYSITEDTSGMVWFVTDREGVFRFDGSAFYSVTLPSSLQGQEISSIIADRLGNLLLAHTSGIDIITRGGNILNYTVGTGDPLNPNLNAYCRDRSGRIWIAGQNRLVRYHPLGIATQYQPRTLLTDVRVFLTPVDFSERYIFDASENYLTFDFTGLWYSDPDNVSFRYRIEGLDPDWNVTREHSVTYQNIPAGTYRFVLESSNSGLFLGDNSVDYRFHIRKPFYRTGIFIVSMLILLLLATYITLHIRDQRLSRAAALQRRQIESQLQTLKAQINPHFLFNSFNTLASVIEEDPKSAVEYVENLSDFYRSILQYREKNLIPLAEELDIISKYRYILQRRYGAALKIEIADTWPEGWVVPLVLQILIENAVKHNVISEHKPLAISVHMHEENAVIVENTLQRRQVVEDSTGFGLQSVISRYALLTRRPVQVDQTQDRFSVIIPVLSHEVSDH